MTDQDTVVANLRALGESTAVFRDGKRVLSNGYFPPPLPALLREIEATVMTRQLSFRAGQSHLCFLVSERRLMMLISASDDMAEVAEYISAPLSHDQPDMPEAIAMALVRLAQNSAAILVETNFAQTDVMGSNLGLPVAILQDIMQIDPADQDHPMTLFIEACGGHYVACLLNTSGAWLGAAEDTTIMARLQAIADRQWSDFKDYIEEHAPQPSANRMVTLGQAMAGGLSVTAVWANGEYALLAHDSAEQAALYQLWQNYFTL